MHVPCTTPFIDGSGKIHMRPTPALAQQCLRGSRLGGGVLVQAPRVAACDSKDAAGQCTVGHGAGAYGFSGSGTILTNPLGLSEGATPLWAFSPSMGRQGGARHLRRWRCMGKWARRWSCPGPMTCGPTVPFLELEGTTRLPRMRGALSMTGKKDCL